MLPPINRIGLIICLFFISNTSVDKGQPYFEYPLGSDGYITNWLLLGPYSNSTPGTQSIGEHGAECFGYHNDLLTDVGGEAGIFPAMGETTISISLQEHTWQPFFSLSPWIDFNSIFTPNDDVVAYAFVLVHVDAPRQVTLGLSHNDGMKIWLNEQLEYAEHTAQVVLNSISLPVTLHQGDNRLLIKVDEKKGGWGFGLCVKPADPDIIVKVPATNNDKDLQALLFKIGTLQDTESLQGKPIYFNFPARDMLLPKPVDIPLVLLDSIGQQIAQQILNLGQMLKGDYPLNFELLNGKYQLALADQEDIPVQSLEVVEQKVFNDDKMEVIGKRPYEMGDRPGFDNPLVDFEDLQDWWIQSQNGASARLYRSRVQQMDGEYVARVVYRGNNGSSTFTFGPPAPIPIPEDADNVGIWIYGNNWGWTPDPATPQVGVQILLQNDEGQEHIISLGRVDWKEWFLRQLPIPYSGEKLFFKGIRILGCSNLEERTLFFDSVKFFHEEWRPLNIEPLPDMLPFLTTEQTIVPIPEDTVETEIQLNGNKFQAICRKKGREILYECIPSSGTLSDISVQTPFGQVIKPFLNGGLQFQLLADLNRKDGGQERSLIKVEQKAGHPVYFWRVGEIDYKIELSVLYNSLLIDISSESDQVTGLHFGTLKSSESAKLIRIPMLTYGLPDPQVVCSGDVFIFAILDHYRSHASRLYARNEVISDNNLRFNGGCRYHPKTNQKRNTFNERIVLTVSSNFHDVLPNIPHPPSPMGKFTCSRLWKENWGMPTDTTAHDKFYWGLKLLRDYGVAQFIVRHHEETWRDGGESFTMRLQAAPKKGGDQSLIDYVRRVKELGFICGLYTNYIDFAPVNANWSSDRVARLPDGSFVKAWPRCYTLKPILSPKFEAQYAPAIHQKYGPNTVYCDVHTAVAPWERVDYDQRVPEAGMFRAQHKAYSLVLKNEKKSYQGPVFSEGLYHWFYAGLTDGNYGQIKDSQPSKIAPLVDFNLLRIHPLEVGIGMGGPFMFYPGGVNADERNSRSAKFDRFLATTIAYGHNGYLIDIPTVNDSTDTQGNSAWGIPAILKSYFMMQQLQTRYALKKVNKILYYDGNKWLYSNKAIRNNSFLRGQIRVSYEGGLETVVNLNETEDLTTFIGTQEISLPPNGYAAVGPEFMELSGYREDRRVDIVVSPEYIYADGRGQELKTGKITLTNSAVILKDKGAIWLVPIDEKESVSFRQDILGLSGPVTIEGCDRNGKVVDSEVDYKLKEGWVTLQLRAGIFKYLLAKI